MNLGNKLCEPKCDVEKVMARGMGLEVTETEGERHQRNTVSGVREVIHFNFPGLLACRWSVP